MIISYFLEFIGTKKLAAKTAASTKSLDEIKPILKKNLTYTVHNKKQINNTNKATKNNTKNNNAAGAKKKKGNKKVKF